MPIAKTAITVPTSADDALHAAHAPRVTPTPVGAEQPRQPGLPDATRLDDLEDPYDNVACTD